MKRFERVSDEGVVGLLADVRRRVGTSRAARARRYAAALLELELEAVRRDLPVPGVHEPMAPPVARQKLAPALRAGDDDAFAQIAACLDIDGLWRAYRLALDLPCRAARLRALEQVAWQMDVRLYGVDAAGRRRRRCSGVEAVEGRVAALRSGLDFAFGRLLGGRPRANGD